MIVSADISYYQPQVNDQYTRQWLIFRCCDGDFLDPHAVGNADWCRGAVAEQRMAGWTAYVVYRPGMNDAILNHLAQIVPLDRVEIDIESWPANGKPTIIGDHSDEINSLARDLGSIVGPSNVWRYGNAGDLASIHPHPSPGQLTRLAKYSPSPPVGVANLIGWQYTDGQIASAGRPTASAPFGPCDHNELYIDELSPESGGGTQLIGAAMYEVLTEGSGYYFTDGHSFWAWISAYDPYVIQKANSPLNAGGKGVIRTVDRNSEAAVIRSTVYQLGGHIADAPNEVWA